MFDRAHVWTLLLAAGLLSAPSAAPSLSPQTDLDAFMQKVLAHRDENWKRLQQYILEERQEIQVRGISNTPLWGERRDFSWFIRDGYFVRSPVTVNGVTVSETERRKAEDAYLAQAKARDRRGRGGRAAGAAGTPAGGTTTAEPRPPPRCRRTSARCSPKRVSRDSWTRRIFCASSSSRAPMRSSATRRSKARTSCASSTTRRASSRTSRTRKRARNRTARARATSSSTPRSSGS